MSPVCLSDRAGRWGSAPLALIDGGTAVAKGCYFSTHAWSMTLARDGEVLGGNVAEKYLRVPLCAALVLAPLVGALFLAALPVVGLYVTARAVLSSRTEGERERGGRVIRLEDVVAARRSRDRAAANRQGAGESDPRLR